MQVGNQNQPGSQTNMADAYSAAGGNTEQVNRGQQGGQSGGVPARVAFGRNRAPISRDSASETVNHMIKAIKDYIDQNDDFKKMNLRTIAIPRESGIAAPAIVIAMPGELKGNPVISYHTLILADDAGQLREQFESADNQQYLVPKATSDFLDAVYIDNIRTIVEREFPQAGLLYADAEVVPVGYNYKDEGLLRNTIANALEAAWGEIASRQPNFQYLSLKDVQGANLALRTHYHQDEIIDSVGQPIRADIQIDFRSEPNNGGNQQTENIEQTETFAQTSGYVDLVYDPVNPAVNQWMLGQQQRTANDCQLFSAQLVITNVFAPAMGGDLSATLLAIYNTFSLAADNQPFLQAFLPPHLLQQRQNSRQGGFDPKNVGALNYEFGLPDPKSGQIIPFPTGPGEFQAQDFYAWMQMNVRKGLSIAIDVPEAGDTTWFLRAFSACRDIDGPAHKAIVAAADALTGGRFSEIFNKTSRMIITGHENRIFLGTYTDAAGVKHDLRNVDLLYMLNKDGHQNPTIGRQFSNTFNNDIPSVNVNLAKRLQFINGAVSDVKVTGFARREALHLDFVTSLDAAIAQTGLRIRQTYDSGSNRIEHRATGNLYGSQALIGGLNSQTFTSGSTQGAGGHAARPMYQGGRSFY